MACELYCCLLPQCEVLRICRSGFPIATIVLKFGLEIQLGIHNYLSIVFCDFPLTAQSGKSHVTINLIACAPHI